ncbi:MAG: hypothetical protein P8P66_14795 [Paracoccaceae bacterium]|nr:hypothetical protein [Paracoccaceae bacterium]
MQRHGSMNGMATGQTALTVGGIIGAAQRPAPATGHPAAFSSASVLGDDSVDLCAIVDRSVEQGGVVASGTRNGSRAVLRGTSMAAPQAGRSLITAFHTVGTNLINSTAAGNYLGLIEVDPDWVANTETGELAARIGKGALRSHVAGLYS